MVKIKDKILPVFRKPLFEVTHSFRKDNGKKNNDNYTKQQLLTDRLRKPKSSGRSISVKSSRNNAGKNQANSPKKEQRMKHYIERQIRAFERATIPDNHRRKNATKLQRSEPRNAKFTNSNNSKANKIASSKENKSNKKRKVSFSLKNNNNEDIPSSKINKLNKDDNIIPKMTLIHPRQRLLANQTILFSSQDHKKKNNTSSKESLNNTCTRSSSSLNRVANNQNDKNPDKHQKVYQSLKPRKLIKIKRNLIVEQDEQLPSNASSVSEGKQKYNVKIISTDSNKEKVRESIIQVYDTDDIDLVIESVQKVNNEKIITDNNQITKSSLKIVGLECNRKENTDEKMQWLLNFQHPLVSLQSYCKRCNKQMSNLDVDEWMIHYSDHHNYQPYQCIQCKKTYQQAMHYYLHLERHKKVMHIR